MTYTRLILAGIALSICFSFVQSNKGHDWDYLMFTQQWPVTSCMEWEEHGHSHKCQFPNDKDSWTVHGIWPNKANSMGPFFCNNSWHFDPEQVKPIETTLLQVWTNIEAETSTYSLWAHEWNKHGTCAASLNTLNSEFKYFSAGIDWVNKYKMLDLLAQSNINPSNDQQYNIVEINNAVKTKLGISPQIECRNINGKSYIIELRVCITKNFTLRDCEGQKVRIGDDEILTNCDVSKGIIYPKTEMPVRSFIVELYKAVNWLQWLTF